MKRWPIVILFYRNPYKNFLTSQFGHHFLVIVTVADHEVFVGNWLLSLYIMLVQIFRNFMGGESVSRSHRSGWFRLRLNGRFLVFGLGFTSPCARFWAHLDLSSTVLIIVFFSLYFIKELDKHPWQYCFGTCLVYTFRNPSFVLFPWSSSRVWNYSVKQTFSRMKIQTIFISHCLHCNCMMLYDMLIYYFLKVPLW